MTSQRLRESKTEKRLICVSRVAGKWLKKESLTLGISVSELVRRLIDEGRAKRAGR
jgi:hypothetical protein